MQRFEYRVGDKFFIAWGQEIKGVTISWVSAPQNTGARCVQYTIEGKAGYVSFWTNDAAQEIKLYPDKITAAKALVTLLSERLSENLDSIKTYELENQNLTIKLKNAQSIIDEFEDFIRSE